MEATADFNELYYANYDNNQNIFDEAGTLIGNYNIPEGHKLFGNYDITDNWEETFHGYMVLNENAIHIGQYIRNIKRQKNEMYIMLNCIIDSEGKVILKEFTKQNLGKPIAVVFEDKIIVVTVMREIIENEIAFGIRY
jgi:preprotein translocase subunit SecD